MSEFPNYFKEMNYRELEIEIIILSPDIAVATVTYSIKVTTIEDKTENIPKMVKTYLFRKL